MNAKHYVTGHFINAAGEQKEFVSMKVFADRSKAFRYELEAARKLRAEGCKRIVLRTH